MAVKIRFDTAHNPECPTFELADRIGNKLGMLDLVESITLKSSLQEPDTITFTVHKSDNGRSCRLWDKLTDFRLVHCREWDAWFQAHVTYSDDQKTTKAVHLTGLGEAETSQVLLHDVEINTESDISREDYTPTVFYDPADPKTSLLDRLLAAAPHYTIDYVEPRLNSLQRTFSFDGITLYDALQEIAQEIGCLFRFRNGSHPDGSVQRSLSVYDLQSYCTDCGCRGEFSDVCPECGGENILEGYGDDTAICFSTEDLADSITLESDLDSMKNCFRIAGGDELFTATVKNCLPDGSGYYWHISDEMKEEMPDSLASKLNEYETSYAFYRDSCTVPMDPSLLADFEVLKTKYAKRHPVSCDLSGLTGFTQLIQAIYEIVDFSYFLSDSLLPDASTEGTTAAKEAARITSDSVSEVAVPDASYLSLSSVSSAVLGFIRTFIHPNYQIKVQEETLSGSLWTGNFRITSYYDEQDSAVSQTVSVIITDEYEKFLRQKLDKTLSSQAIPDYSLTELFHKSQSEFQAALANYGKTSLDFILDACQTCLDILIEQGISDPETWSGSASDLYSQFYVPYRNKYKAIEAEIAVRSQELALLNGCFDADGRQTAPGILPSLENQRDKIRADLCLEDFLGETLWKQLYLFRREDTYENPNYLSEGLTTPELLEKAAAFVKLAEAEIRRASVVQKTLSANLKNLLVIREFAPFAEHFECGNWLRAKVEDQVFKFRLLDYEISYSDLSQIHVTFSNIVTKNSPQDRIQSTLQKASSMATSYSSLRSQAAKGDEAEKRLRNWTSDGLAMTNMKIVNNADNQDIVYDSHGLLFRKKDELLDTYSPDQLKIVNSTLAVTDDAWETTKAAIGRFYYRDPSTGKMTEAYGVNAKLLIGDVTLGQQLGIYNEDGTMRFDREGLTVTDTNGHPMVRIDPKTGQVLLNATSFTLHSQSIETVVQDTAETTAKEIIEEALPYTLECISTMGFQVLDGKGSGVVYYRLYKNGEEVDPIKSTRFLTAPPASAAAGDFFYYIDTAAKEVILKKFNGSSWVAAEGSDLPSETYLTYRFDKNGEPLDGGNAWRTGKAIYLEGGMIDKKCTFLVKVP
jgi:hypothetical protein